MECNIYAHRPIKTVLLSSFLPGGAAGAPEEVGARASQELQCVSGEAEAGEPGGARGGALGSSNRVMGEREREGQAGKLGQCPAKVSRLSALSDQEAGAPGHIPGHVPV